MEFRNALWYRFEYNTLDKEIKILTLQVRPKILTLLYMVLFRKKLS
jgi:hypothetical protein